MRAFVVLGLVFSYQSKRLAWGTSPKSPILCRVGHKNHNSVNQSTWQMAIKKMSCEAMVTVCLRDEWTEVVNVDINAALLGEAD